MTTLYDIENVFHLNAFATVLDEWEYILAHHGECVTDEEIWDIVRGCEKPPHLGNLYQSLVFDRMESIFYELTGLSEGDVEIEREVNGWGSSFRINGMAIKDEDTFYNLVEQHQEAQAAA